MAKSFLLEPDVLVQRLLRRYLNKRTQWLTGGEWPMRMTLGAPTQSLAQQHVSQVRAWQQAWTHWNGSGTLSWVERRWPVLGKQLLPDALTFASATEVARFIGKADEWEQFTRRFCELTERWPVLLDALPGHMRMIADWRAVDFDIFLKVLAWLDVNPDCGLYLRQLPIAGVDGKWLESRRALVRNFLCILRGCTPHTGDFYTLTGLKRLPLTLHLRLLDPQLRARVGGLGDLQIPVSELAALRLPLEKVYIVENLQTGLAFEDIPGALVFMKQGYAVDLFGQLPWLNDLRCFYWGDLDTHGFAILNRLRHYLPHVKSVLMDRDTLLCHRELWGIEDKPAGVSLPKLSIEEAALYQDLCDCVFGLGVRLEQERINWDYAWNVVSIC